MSDKRAIETLKELLAFCNSQVGCQNCVFRKYGSDSWKCNLGDVQYADIREIEDNYKAKLKNHGYI